jgi:uncharacterized protein
MLKINDVNRIGTARIFYEPHFSADASNHFDCDCYVSPRHISAATAPDVVREQVYYPALGLQAIPITLDNESFYALFIPSISRVVVVNDIVFKTLHPGGFTISQICAENSGIANLEQVLAQLVQLEFLLPRPFDQPRPHFQTTTPLSVWLHVTNACNLACHYCYIDKSQQQMTAATGYAAIDATMRAAHQGGYQEVVVKYAGGEPTLVMDAITEIHTYAMTQAATAGFRLRGTVLSNGVGLTPAKVKRLKELGLNLTISLDGLGAEHDEQRPTRAGKGSSQLVTQGIENAIAGDINPAISITVTDSSSEGLVELVEWILEHELFLNIHFYRSHQSVPINKNSPRWDVQEERIIARMRQVFSMIEQHLPHYSLLQGLVDYANLGYAHQTPCSAGKDYLVYNHQGQLAICQMLMDHPVGDVHTENPLNAIRTADIPIRNIPVDERGECASCEWRYWCAGGCPVQTFRALGHNKVKSPNCHIYKALYPEVIRLEALRLMQYHNLPSTSIPEPFVGKDV